MIRLLIKIVNIIILLFILSAFVFSQKYTNIFTTEVEPREIKSPKETEPAEEIKTPEEIEPIKEVQTFEEIELTKEIQTFGEMQTFEEIETKSLSSSKKSDNNESFMRGRNIIGVNFKPLISTTVGVAAFNSIFNKNSIFGFKSPESLNKYTEIFKSDSKSYGGLNLSYTFFVTEKIGLEATLGYARFDYGLIATKDSISNFLPDNINDYVYDSYVKAKVLMIPTTISVKLYGKKQIAFNAFHVGITTFMYDIETKNGLTGIITKQSVTDPTVYLSYEFGWKIELFPTKSWRVKPILDISLIEIGYYVRPWAPNLYSALSDSFIAFGSGLSLDSLIPSWNSMPGFVKQLANIRFVLFPRIGFSLRF